MAITMSFTEKQRETLERHQPGTGTWLIDHNIFQSWVNGNGEPVLWCSGIPGARKTVMASLVIEYLKEAPQTASNAVACIFCDYKDQTQQNVVNLIFSITRQLASQSDNAMDKVKTIYR
jgi:hypothetical protein